MTCQISFGLAINTQMQGMCYRDSADIFGRSSFTSGYRSC